MTDPIINSLFLRPTDTDEIIKEINQMKNKSTLDIRVPLLKHVKQELADGLVIIFNKSFQEGCFPGVLKLAKVIPIHKGDETTDPTNYRPISLLSAFDKLIEKVMLNRLLKFLKKNNILYKYQFGFRKNHATAHALTEVTDNIYRSLDEGNYVFGIYIDLKKAFFYCTTSDSIIFSLDPSPSLPNWLRYGECSEDQLNAIKRVHENKQQDTIQICTPLHNSKQRGASPLFPPPPLPLLPLLK